MNSKHHGISEMKSAFDKTAASFNVLFDAPAMDGSGFVPGVKSADSRFLACLRLFLLKLGGELEEQSLENAAFTVRTDVANLLSPDSVDAMNSLLKCSASGGGLRRMIDDSVFDALMELNDEMKFSHDILKSVSDPSTRLFNSVAHAIQFAGSFARLLDLYSDSLAAENPGAVTRLNPAFFAAGLVHSHFLRAKPRGIALELAKRYEENDVFSKGRSFRCGDGRIAPVELTSIRPADDFYGYAEAKRVLNEHFDAFIAGKHNVPLMLGGLPGLGKTQMTIAFVLKHPELLLVLADPEELQSGLEKLIKRLEPYRARKFVVFFDDIDTREINWYSFRTFVGGAFQPPPNIMVVIASNFKFPPNISSRGRVFTFPMFDETRCQEMIEDMFLARGMKHVRSELLSVVAADYVEEFGQKEFDELSPRTLARYLELYLGDQTKRRRMLELSRGELITRPDSQIFYEQNVKLMRAIYGDEILDEIRKKALGEIG